MEPQEATEIVIDAQGWTGTQFWALFKRVPVGSIDGREYVDMKTDGGTVIRIFKEEAK